MLHHALSVSNLKLEAGPTPNLNYFSKHVIYVIYKYQYVTHHNLIPPIFVISKSCALYKMHTPASNGILLIYQFEFKKTSDIPCHGIGCCDYRM